MLLSTKYLAIMFGFETIIVH